mmetsp:Transcript_2543/g.4395  ORF Transcript_2543/g.4395 Transcript_2543/m.4395 type:complete len:123 (-) Transcript_2543:44-412(-)
MRWALSLVLSLVVLVPARHFENDDSLDSVDAEDESREEGFKPADPWRLGAQRVDGNDCKNVLKLGDQAYNCPSYFVASDLTTGSCRTPCFNPTKSPEQCLPLKQGQICCADSAECKRHGCCK